MDPKDSVIMKLTSTLYRISASEGSKANTDQFWHSELLNKISVFKMLLASKNQITLLLCYQVSRM